MSENETIIFILNKLKFDKIRNILMQNNIFKTYENVEKLSYSNFVFDKLLLTNLMKALEYIQQDGLIYIDLNNHL